MKYSKTRIFNLLILASAFHLAGCKKWLDKKPVSYIATPETLADLQALMDDEYTFNLAKTPSLPEASADDYFLTTQVYNKLTLKDQAAYTWSPFSYNTDNDWKFCYLPIYSANLCLEQLGKLEKTSQNSSQWDNIKGSALFFRAYYFTVLAWSYSKAYDSVSAKSDLGIALRLSSDINVPTIRSNVQQTYEQIIKDTKEAIFFLPDIAIHCLRPSKAASYGLLARVYLSMRQYDSALKYSDRCLDISNKIIDFNGDPTDISAPFQGIDVPFRRFNNETIFYTEMNATSSAQLTINAFVAPAIYQLYDVNDLRKYAYFRPGSLGYVFKGNYTGDPVYYFTGIATDEMLLTRAECYARIGGINRTGDKEAALKDLNKLLSKRWNSNFKEIKLNDTKQVLDTLLVERRKELLFRGIRWIELKRLNKEGADIKIERNVGAQKFLLLPNDNRYALPIPQEIIELTGIPQNPR